MRRKSKICCVFNYNPLYRYPIYKEIDRVLHPDFFFGDSVFEPIKQFNPELLSGFKGYIHAKKGKKVIWHTGIGRIFNCDYTDYIITGSTNSLINWAILFYAFVFHKKVSVWCHGLKSDVSRISIKFLYKLFYKLSDRILLYGNYSKPFMEKIGVNPIKLFVIHNSLDTENQTKIYSTLRKTDLFKNHFGNSHPTIIYIGRLQKRKKIEQILEAMLQLNSDGFYINLVVVGGASDDFDFEDKVLSLNLTKQVWLYGPSYDDNINAELIFNSSACVSPGNVGLTCIHSLSFGTPVITNDNFSAQMPEFEAVKDGITGSFFHENDILDLAEKIRFWTSADDEVREKTRLICRNSILKDWSVDYQINLLKSLFSDNDLNLN